MRALLLHFLGLAALGAVLVWLGEGGFRSEPALDLTRLSWYAKAGFAPADRHGWDPSGAPPVDRFPIALPRLFARAAPDAVDYVLETAFPLPSALSAPGSLAGLALSSIAGSYEIYLNGALIAGGVERDRSGRILSPHIIDDLVIPLPREHLRAGANRLVIRIAHTHPTVLNLANERIGLLKAQGYEIGEFTALWTARGAWPSVFFGTLYTLLGFFSVLLGLALRRSHKLIRFGLLALSLAVYFAASSIYAADATGDSDLLNRVEVIALYLASTFGAMFLMSMLAATEWLSRLGQAFALAGVAGACAAVVLPFDAAIATLPLWEFAVLVALLLGMVPASRALARSEPSNAAFLPGLILFVLAAGWDIAASLTQGPSLRVAPYGAFLFVAALTAGMAQQSLLLHRAAERASAALVSSERRLSTFYSATREAVCIRRGDTILDVNPAFEALFGVRKEHAAGSSFRRLFAHDDRTGVPTALKADRSFEAVAMRSDGSRFDAECLHRSADNKDPDLFVTAIRDITDYKRYRNDLLQRNEELEALNRIVVDRELHMVELKGRIRSAGGKPAGGA